MENMAETPSPVVIGIEEQIKNDNNKRDKQETPKERRLRRLKQAFTVFLASVGMWNIGTVTTFPSVLAEDLKVHNTTIYGSQIVLSETEMDMMGSLLTIFTLVGAIVIILIMTRVMRRMAMAFSGIVFVVSWLSIVFLPGTIGMIVARCLGGVGFGMMGVVVDSYTVEIADPEIRGSFFLFNTLGVQLGHLLTITVGHFARYYSVALINLVVPIFFLISIYWVPESPSLLVIKGRLEEAKSVLRNLRGPSADIDLEIKNIQNMNNYVEGGKTSISPWKELLTPQSLKSLAVVVALHVFLCCIGYYVVLANASRFLTRAGSSIDESFASIFVIVAQVLSSLLAALLMDQIGRKKILYVSYTVSCMALIFLAVYTGLFFEESLSESDISTPTISDVDRWGPEYTNPIIRENQSATIYLESFSKKDGFYEVIEGDFNRDVYNGIHPVKYDTYNSSAYDVINTVTNDSSDVLGWLPLTSLMILQAGICLGALPVAYMLSSEYFPASIRPQTIGASFGLGAVASFFILHYYTPMTETLTQAGTYALFACAAALGVPFTRFFIKETMGEQVG